MEAARRRGVTVVLLDDGGLRDVAAGTVGLLRAAIAEAVDACPAGSVTARAVPPGRAAVLTLLTRTDTGVTRVELDRSARPLPTPRG